MRSCDECGGPVESEDGIPTCINCGLEHHPIWNQCLVAVNPPLENRGKGSFQLNAQLKGMTQKWNKRGVVEPKNKRQVRAMLREFIIFILDDKNVSKATVRESIHTNFPHEVTLKDVNEAIRILKRNNTIMSADVKVQTVVEGYRLC